MSKINRMVPVYYRGESRRAPAKDYVGESGAEDLVTSGVAEWSKNGKTLILNKTRGALKLRDESCSPTIAMVEKAMAGVDKYKAIIAAWAPNMVGIAA